MEFHGRGWLTFDCYGTLVDWRTGMERALDSVAPGRAAELLAGYHRHEPLLEARSPAPAYRAVLSEGLASAAGELGLDLTPEQASVLADTLPTWPVFPEVPRVLRALKAAGWRLGILSNVDDDLIAETIPQLGADIDAVVTAQSVGSYKPALTHFATFRTRAQPGEGEWLHVACSWFHDVEPCREIGVPVVFVNREGDVRDTGQVVAMLPDLSALPDVVQNWSLENRE
ncbi:HAD family hydrolase [Nonomuraea lactucae]|uniref:HAD family hydrolase n=1 Tax=Nonomuraea lactucae TaxID=2249762 RepID=UPI000DE1D1EA|nr:HAD family hydrolase [Nonomuraea lactucae]